MSNAFSVSKRKRKQKFGGRLKDKKAKRFGAPQKGKKSKNNFGKPEKKSKANSWLKWGQTKKDDWGKPQSRGEVSSPDKKRNWFSGFFKKRDRRPQGLNRYWGVRDQISDELQRRQTLIESRLKNTGDEIGQLVTGIAGKPLSGNQKVQIANYIDRKKQEVTQGATLVEQAVSFIGSLFGRKVG